jgi:tetratricopeptide (TPR) repeat protein
MDPRDVASYEARALALVKLGRVDEALASAQWIHHIAPHDIESYVKVAGVYAMVKRFPDAIGWYDAGIRAFPRNPRAYTAKAEHLHALGVHAEAIRVLDYALSLAPNDDNAWYNRACAFARLNQKDHALYSLSRAIAIRPSAASTARIDGDLKRFVGDPDFERLCPP